MSEPIDTNRQQPAEVTVDGQTVKQHPLRDQIEADRYVASKAARRNPFAAAKTAKIVGPSMGGD